MERIIDRQRERERQKQRECVEKDKKIFTPFKPKLFPVFDETFSFAFLAWLR